MKLFRPISSDALHNLRVLLEKSELPNAAALEQAAVLINKTEAYRDAIAKGLVGQVTASDLGEFYNRYRERYQVDATRRTAEKNAKKSALRADQVEDILPDDVALSDELQGFMRGRTSVQNNGTAMVGLGEIVAIAGGHINALSKWLSTERLAFAPNFPELVKHALGFNTRMEARVKAA